MAFEKWRKPISSTIHRIYFTGRPIFGSQVVQEFPQILPHVRRRGIAGCRILF
jgi:hypothetical protein